MLPRNGDSFTLEGDPIVLVDLQGVTGVFVDYPPLSIERVDLKG